MKEKDFESKQGRGLVARYVFCDDSPMMDSIITTNDIGKDGILFTEVHHEDGTVEMVELKKGEKISGRYGNKGVIQAIENDSKMPHLENGETVKVIPHPMTATPFLDYILNHRCPQDE